MKLRLLLGALTLAAGLLAYAADPTATHYNATQCQGSAMPYPVPAELLEVPDSLTPVMVNHVGRHGARFLSSPRAVNDVRQALLDADSLGTITRPGRRVLALTDYLLNYCKGRWGALDSLGMAEQRGIASRMVRTYPRLFKDGRVRAVASKVPRCVNSMYTFLYQLTRLDSSVDITATSGPMESTLLRPFDTDAAYLDWRDEEVWRAPYDEFAATAAPLQPLIRLLGKEFPMQADEARSLVMSLYSMVAGMEAMSLKVDVAEIFTPEEYNALWACHNLEQYLKRTATTLSMVPAEIAAPLLLDIINSTDAAVEASSKGGKNSTDGTALPTAILRFGHAETIMPLLSLMRLPGAYYMTNYFDTVGLHWHNFYVAPMASNLQMVIFRTRAGRYYVRFALNEVPVSLDPDTTPGFIPWEQARHRLLRCIPLYLRG
ncbi:MAG: histidine phosphatase family protein [Candidatus Amulumruptor caecigallinarius]|nr:histidine phosphatase family protein [Candidatus Amulumruptor caecigallinarius]MCM1396441.1 histidine phosphatase family protein [Candidatus Amulumruptor caecigallinarius]MCM1453502.1 histidine phosphatase family protein [bacterium]